MQTTGMTNNNWQTDEDPHQARRHPLLLQEANSGATELQSPGEGRHLGGRGEEDLRDGAGWRAGHLVLKDGEPGEEEWKGEENCRPLLPQQTRPSGFTPHTKCRHHCKAHPGQQVQVHPGLC